MEDVKQGCTLGYIRRKKNKIVTDGPTNIASYRTRDYKLEWYTLNSREMRASISAEFKIEVEALLAAGFEVPKVFLYMSFYS